MNGKGDKQRKGANNDLYSKNWEIIFGGKQETEKKKKTMKMKKRKPTTPLTIIRTGTGDFGTTHLREPGVRKDDPLVDFVGTLDEACAALGLCSVGFDFGSSEECDLQRELGKLFNESIKSFFIIGALIHSPSKITEDNGRHFNKLVSLQSRMEAAMKQLINNDYVEPLPGFIVPNEENADLFLARAVVRRAEREAIRCGEMWVVPYLNTLSDFLFTLSWYESHFYETWDGLDS